MKTENKNVHKQTLRETAKEYVSPTTETIDKLDSFNIDIEVELVEYLDGSGKPFTVYETIIDEVKYRVPKTIIKQIQDYLHEKPDIKLVKVKKTGEGINSSYTLIVLE